MTTDLSSLDSSYIVNRKFPQFSQNTFDRVSNSLIIMMKKKFDFSRYAYKGDGETSQPTVSHNPPAKLVVKPAPVYSSDEEQSNEGNFQTRAGRRVQPIVTVIDDSSDASSEEENEDAAFKAFLPTAKSRPNGKAKPAKKNTKSKEELDLSKEFVALRSTNKSITVDKPLKSISNKLSNFEIAAEKQTLSDEINLLLGTDDSNQSSDSRSKKRKVDK